MAMKLSKVPLHYKNVCGVYLISCGSGAKRYIYVGSSKNVYVRAKEHLNSMKRGEHCSLQEKFNELGEDEFCWMLLEDCSFLLKRGLDNHELNFELQKIEQKFIDKYLAIFLERFLNKAKTAFGTAGISFKQSEETCRKKSISLMGHPVTQKVRETCSKKMIGVIASQETRKKMSLSRLGKKHTQEWKNNLSMALKGKYTGVNSSFYGRRHSEETKKKMSEARKEYYRRKKCLQNITNEEARIGEKICPR